ncbi:ankyrin repeat and MYND domain-containing protein 1 [Aulostomus maculatus]
MQCCQICQRHKARTRPVRSENHEGSWWKDLLHGDGVYCWSTGDKFTGKFYLGRREGYGQHNFPDGTTFKGLYHDDQRFGPGVLSYPDGSQDVGLWIGPCLLKLCTSVEVGFSLKEIPELAPYVNETVTTGSLSQVDTDPRTLWLDESFVLSSGCMVHRMCGDCQRELDQLFFGELWDPALFRGYERHQLSRLPLQTRMQANIHIHRALAENLDWDVAAVLSSNRDSFGPKGPLEVSSELFIQQASRGDLNAVSKTLAEGHVYADVADSHGHTALMAATVNCHKKIINLLLDLGADIDWLNREGMSALAVSHVLYYHLQSKNNVFTEPAAKRKNPPSQPACASRCHISPLDSTTSTSQSNNRPKATDMSRNTRSRLSDQHRHHLSTLELLLERGADPNISRVPMPVLLMAVMAADAEAVKRLLLRGARTDIPLPPERKGLYPLHVAAGLAGPAGPLITEMLLHTITDPDAQARNQDEIYEPDERPLSTNEAANPREGGQTALHVACQRHGDHENANKVVTLLLSKRARTDLLWNGHSPLSLAVASGNDTAVAELLKGGADPNAPLGCRVGSALCALTSVSHHQDGKRAKLLDMLVKAGADVLMPVKVGDFVGNAVDYAHRLFNQDSRFANTPVQDLTPQEKKTLKEWRQLLSKMGDLMRQTFRLREARERKMLTTSEELRSSRKSQPTATEKKENTKTQDSSIGRIPEDPGNQKPGKKKKQEKEEHPVLNRESEAPTSCKSHWEKEHPITEKPKSRYESKPPIKEKPKLQLPYIFCWQCCRSVGVKLTPCSRCCKIYYCSEACQRESWEESHKKECVKISKQVSSAEDVGKTRANLKENYSFI